jgi:hypothetical protein
MSNQYLCGTGRPDSSLFVFEVQIRDQHAGLQQILALMNHGGTTIFISLRLLNRLGLPHKAAHIRTHSLDSQVFVHARKCCKMAKMVHDMDHVGLVHEPEVLVIPIRTYDLVLGLALFICRKPDRHWDTGRLTALRTACGQGEACRSGMIVWWYEGWDDQSTNL